MKYNIVFRIEGHNATILCKVE